MLTVVGFCAPSDALSFGIGNETVGSCGTPETEIVKAVDNGRLAKRVLVLGGGVAKVVTLLGSSFAVASVDLVWQRGVRVRMGRECESVHRRRLSGDFARRGDCQQCEAFRDHRLEAIRDKKEGCV
jgi:hypothetical protein